MFNCKVLWRFQGAMTTCDEESNIGWWPGQGFSRGAIEADIQELGDKDKEDDYSRQSVIDLEDRKSLA